MSPDATDPLALTLGLGSIYAADDSTPPTSPPPRSIGLDDNTVLPSRVDDNPGDPVQPGRHGLDDNPGQPRRRGLDANPGNPVQPRRRRHHRTERPPPPPSNGVAAPPPFPWATERPARHDTLGSLLSRGITSVTGEARCRSCSATAAVAYDLDAKFREVRDYVAANLYDFNDRAPEKWMKPALPDCAACGEAGTMEPVIAADYSKINWLFLLLGQTLGCCTLDQLKYFCKETGQHRTGAKNRIVYYAFIEMCRQLQP